MNKVAMTAAVLATIATAQRAEAFCGFYVNGAGGEMFADATQVVLMRMGTRTVLSMQNAYKGPVEDFALVIPVPVVLQEPDVKTLPKEVFGKVDTMGAPRLVEYWEVDPCAVNAPGADDMMRAGSAAPPTEEAAKPDQDYGVKVEAEFTVGEYQIVILSATDSTGLDRWLKDTGYKIPDGAEPLLRPYVEGGSKFFVAKVDPKKVTFDSDGRAQLSPLRFHYDADELVLPIRLGLANSSGKQDLIVNVLSPEGRFEVSNYPNVTIPTNLDVKDDVRNRFGEFYAALFDRTVEKNPGAVVTEYAWDASSCDPCPGPVIDYNDLATLGTDVLGGGKGQVQPYESYGMVLTRLHARYGASDIKDDLVFKAAKPIVGGREFVVDQKTGKLEERSREDSMNNFQGRYAIRHAWTGAMDCKDPIRNRWGGPPADVKYDASPKAARDLAFAPRGAVELPALVAMDIPEIDVKAAGAAATDPAEDPGKATDPATGKPADPTTKVDHDKPKTDDKKKGCGCQSGPDAGGGGLLLLGLAGLLSRRRRSRV
jgi:MYXO-CTERM domain-containing protein